MANKQAKNEQKQPKPNRNEAEPEKIWIGRPTRKRCFECTFL